LNDGLFEKTYITWGDSDDYYINMLMCKIVKQNHIIDGIVCDRLDFVFLQETEAADGKKIFSLTFHNNTWMFGKFYWLPFICNNNINFPTNIIVAEDSSFNTQTMQVNGARKFEMNQYAYVWAMSPVTTVRGNDYDSSSQDSHLIAWLDQLIGRREDAVLYDKFLWVFVYAWSHLSYLKYNDYRESCLKILRDYCDIWEITK